MHSLKPTGDNIAHEFYNILKEAGVAGSVLENLSDLTSKEEVPAEVATLDELVRQLEGHGNGPSPEEAQADMAEFAANMSLEEPMQSFEVSEASDNLLDMITDHEDDAEDPVFGMLDDLTQRFEANASEKRVLEGLAKIASSLRGKGEAFAADVVLSTANSIKKDIVKEASKRSHIVSGLKKIASDLYSTGDQLAGDMVQVTINKLGFDMDEDFDKEMNEALKEMDEANKGESDQDKLIRWAYADDDRGKKIRADWTEQAKTDKAVAMLMMQSKQKCPDAWKA